MECFFCYNMESMFAGSHLGSTAFKQPIGNWDVASVTDMYSMFNGAIAFNRDITQWDVSSVNSFNQMFSGATLFDQNISVWNVSSGANVQSMFLNTEMQNQGNYGFTYPQPNKSEFNQPPPHVITSNICFLGDSIVKTDQGEFPIENLEFETLHGERFVRTKTKFLGEYYVVIQKDSIGYNIPNKTTVITPEHKVFVDGIMTEARKLINNDTIYKRKYKGEYVYNILQEEHSDMYVNNMLCETLDPRNSIRNLYTNKSSSKNIIEYNKTMKKYF